MKNQNTIMLGGKLSAAAFITMMAIYLFVSVLVQSILGAVLDTTNAVYLLVCGALPSIAMISATLIFKYKTGYGFCGLVGIEKFNPKHSIGIVLLGVGMFLGLGWLNVAVSLLAQRMGVTVSAIGPPLENAVQVAFSCLVYALLPAIAEEFFFRGVMQKGLKHAGIIACSLVGGLCFALYHGSINQLLYQFVFGVMMCLFVGVSNSVLPAVIVHFLNNLTIIILTYIGVEPNFFSPIIISVGLLCLGGFIALCLTDKNFKIARKKTADNVVRSFMVPLGLVAIIFCAIMIILSAVSL
ncbi:MAG: CPBP family intramembrane metalloprotease [Clostridia bacterium]|nr:CPBP family intramembrane metalloprotease [Clostridia bacterium]